MTFHPIIITEYYTMKASRIAISSGLFFCDFSDIFDKFPRPLRFLCFPIPFLPQKKQLVR